MPADLPIQAISPPPAALSPTKAATTASAAGGASPVGGTAQPGTAPRPSPVAYLDSGLGIVVLEFFGANGKEVSSIPSQRQLDAFRQSEDLVKKASSAPPPPPIRTPSPPPPVSVDGATPAPQASENTEAAPWPIA